METWLNFCMAQYNNHLMPKHNTFVCSSPESAGIWAGRTPHLGPSSGNWATSCTPRHCWGRTWCPLHPRPLQEPRCPGQRRLGWRLLHFLGSCSCPCRIWTQHWFGYLWWRRWLQRTGSHSQCWQTSCSSKPHRSGWRWWSELDPRVEPCGCSGSHRQRWTVGKLNCSCGRRWKEDSSGNPQTPYSEEGWCEHGSCR